jgi:hypothetical protein
VNSELQCLQKTIRVWACFDTVVQYDGLDPRASDSGSFEPRGSRPVYKPHEHFEFDTGNFTDSFRFDSRLTLFELILKS